MNRQETSCLGALARLAGANRPLLASMLKREVQAAYRGSLGGGLWLLLQPLVFMLIYTLVFSVFLKVRFTENGSHLVFSVYLLCGLLPWLAFAEGVAGATFSIRSNVNLVKRVVFPLEVLPAVKIMASLAQQMIGFCLLLPLVWLATGKLGSAAFFLPVPLVLQLIFSLGLGWFFASLTVFIQDLGQILNPLLTVWMFLTPIFYSADVVPEWAAPLLRFNPMARIVGLLRSILLDDRAPEPVDVLVTLGICLLTCALGLAFFLRTKKHFSEML